MKVSQKVASVPGSPHRITNAALNLIVFVCGGGVMALELVGARVMAPYLGTSMYVWTSLIGVVLTCLSVGYTLGGRLADRHPEPAYLSYFLLITGAYVAVVALLGDIVLILLQKWILDIRVGAVLATLLLFGVPGVLLGMVAPFSVRLKLTNLAQTGATAGSLYALSTMGSIIGTFLSGFYLLAHFSHRTVLLMLSLTFLLLAPFARARFSGTAALVLAMCALALLRSPSILEKAMGETFVEEQTAYNRVWIYDGFIGERPVRILQLNDTGDSAQYLDRDEMALDYAYFFNLAEYFKPDIQRALMIGGGAFSIPRHFLREHPESFMDVVEIDPDLERIAREHFNLLPDARMAIHAEDGRTFLNRTRERYDVVYGDAVKSYSVPFQLVTREAMAMIHDRLTDDGVMILNIISSVEGDTGRLFRAIRATANDVFPQVRVFAVKDPEDGARIQNLIMVALKSSDAAVATSDNPDIQLYLAKEWKRDIPLDMPVLTDHLAPVEHYASSLMTGHPEMRVGLVQKNVSALLGFNE